MSDKVTAALEMLKMSARAEGGGPEIEGVLDLLAEHFRIQQATLDALVHLCDLTERKMRAEGHL